MGIWWSDLYLRKEDRGVILVTSSKISSKWGIKETRFRKIEDSWGIVKNSRIKSLAWVGLA